jgi:hypothetical protein
MSYQIHIHGELSRGVLILLCTACAPQHETIDGLDPSDEGRDTGQTK